MHAFVRFALATMLLATGLPAANDVRAAAPTAIELLFERKHLSALDSGAEVAYRFERVASDPKMLGEAFVDTIKLTITAARAEGVREVGLNVFTGDRTRTVQDLPDLTGNPVLIFFLDRTVANMSQLAGGPKPYLKDRIRASLRDSANVEPITMSYAGQTVPAHRIVVTPFTGDPNAARMLGYEGVRLTFVVSDVVPGHIVQMTSLFESGISGAPRLEERIALAGSGGKP